MLQWRKERKKGGIAFKNDEYHVKLVSDETNLSLYHRFVVIFLLFAHRNQEQETYQTREGTWATSSIPNQLTMTLAFEGFRDRLNCCKENMMGPVPMLVLSTRTKSHVDLPSPVLLHHRHHYC